MRILPINDASIAEALTVIRRGGIVAHATETCYGFACDLSNVSAVRRLFTVKQRPTDKPVSALFESVAKAKEYTEWTPLASSQEQGLPGPLTLIVHLTQNPPTPVFPSPDLPPSTVGVRVSSNPLSMRLAREFGSPLSTTSANLGGQPSCYAVDELIAQYDGVNEQPDLILDSGEIPRVPPSTIVDCTGDAPKKIR